MPMSTAPISSREIAIDQHPWVRPRVVSSECLGFAAVRYNGQILSQPFVLALQEFVDIVPVCPEVGIGLGVPRDPIRLVLLGEQRHLIQPATGADVTEAMWRWSRDLLSTIGPVDGFILKGRSPTCGIKDVRVYPPGEGKAPLETSVGLFAEAVMEGMPAAAVEDEGRLTNARIRHNFLTRLFAMAELREVRASNSRGRLVAFHTAYKLVLMAHGQQTLRELGQMVAGASQLPFAEVVDRYALLFARATERPARIPGMVNTLQHAFGYFSDRLSRAEKSFFLALLEELREERVLLNTVLAVLQAWVVRFEEEYLAGQRIFAPYPRELRSLADSGRR
jgi:uncharacterized protein YbgA (DUF1722 family)/uncharacterized protein YbbK (DUF523 family)